MVRQKIGIVFIIWCIMIITGPVCAAGEAGLVCYDDLGRRIELPKAPERVVVLSGSPLDTIFELGAGDQIVGVVDSVITSYPNICRKYPEVLEKPRVGRFDNPYMEKIIELDPDIIMPYCSLDSPGKFTSVFEQHGLPYAGFTTVENLKFGLDQILRMGLLLGKEARAKEMVKTIRNDVNNLKTYIAGHIKKRPVVFYWWGERNATYGRKAAVHELIEMAGGTNLAGDFDRRYMELSPEYIISRDPEVIVISYWQESQQARRLKEIALRPGFSQVRAVKNNRIYTLDGHSLHTPVQFADVVRKLAGYIHPDLFADETDKNKGTSNEKKED